MDLRSSNTYWLLKHGIIQSYPSLQQDIKVDVAIMGAGISGALLANELLKQGHSIAIVDRRHAGAGSTAASTALLQYEIDTPLVKLAEKIGEQKAISSYLLCLDSISMIEKVCAPFKDKALFTQRPSFQYASVKQHVQALEQEYKMRKSAGISLEWLDDKSITTRFGFKKAAGLLSRDAATADAYALTHALLQRGMKKGLKVYDNTEVKAILHEKKAVILKTSDGKKIIAKKLFIACGYESQKYIPYKVQQLSATYAIASEPYAGKQQWYKNALIWETAQPYLYLRTTMDNRIIIGGKDIPFTSAAQRDALIPEKKRALEKSFNSLFPHIPFKTDFVWAGIFAGTKDGLPYIGSIRQRPNTYFALGFGGNGITFSMLAAKMLAQQIKGKKHPGMQIFSFDR